MVGSGPFRFKADERVPGAAASMTKFADYVPRSDGTPDWTAGPKVVHFDRVEWTRHQRSLDRRLGALAGEQDWWEYADHDLLPLLRKART